MVDSSVATAYVAAPDRWSRNGAPIRAITIHMAEGGGTVSWLTRNDGNSSHYVIEYTGRVVQMIPESMAAGSMNPAMTRTTDDAAFTYLGSSCRYGRTALNAAGIASDPNRYAIAFEIEGFAATGPNAKQRASLARLVADIRKRHGALPCLGHRDQQAYKACPGKRIPWVDYGGHGVKTTGAAVTGSTEVTVAIKGSKVPETPTLVTLKPDAADPTKSRFLYVYSDHRADAGNTQLKPNRPLLLTRFIDADTYAVGYEPAAGDANDTSLEMFVKTIDIAKTSPATTPDATPFDQAYVDAEIAKATAAAQAQLEASRRYAEGLLASADQLEAALAALRSATASTTETPT